MIYTRFWCASWAYVPDQNAASLGCGSSVGEYIAAESAKNAAVIFRLKYPTAKWVKVDGVYDDELD